MEFSRQEYWGRLPFPSTGDLPNPGIEPGSPALEAESLPTESPRKPFTFTLREGRISCEELWKEYPGGGIKKWKTLKWELPGVFETNKEASVNYVCGFIVLGIFDFLFGLFVLMDKHLCIWVKIIG